MDYVLWYSKVHELRNAVIGYSLSVCLSGSLRDNWIFSDEFRVVQLP